MSVLDITRWNPTTLFSVVPTAAYQQDPYPFLAELRKHHPVFRSARGSWVLTRHADVATVVRDQALSNDPHRSGLHEHYLRSRTDDTLGERALGHLQFLDAPDHGRIRDELVAPFTGRAVERLRPVVQAHVDRLLNAAGRSEGPVDLVSALAYPLPLAVILELVGLPTQDAPRIERWTRLLIANDDPDFLVGDRQRAEAAVAATEFGRYLSRHAVRCGRDGGEGLLGALVGAHQGGRLDVTEVVVNVMFVVVASLETTAGLITNGMHALFADPAALERWRAEPGLDRSGVEELLRFDSPIQYTPRFTTEEYEVAGTTIPAGAHLMALLGAANRDPDAFAGPDRLELDRTGGRRHLAFGGGAHFCIGSVLARLEGQLLIPGLIRRFPDMRPAGTPRRREMFTLRGFDTMPVSLHGRSPVATRRRPAQ